MRRHRAGDKPGRGEDEGQYGHSAARCRRGLSCISDVRAGGGARGIRKRFNGSPITDCSAAQMRHVARHPNCASRKADSGHPTVLAKPAIKVIPVIGPRAARP